MTKLVLRTKNNAGGVAPFPAIDKHVFDVGVSSAKRTSVTFSNERQFSHLVTTKKSVQQKSLEIIRVRHIHD
jgi:hypothetical protein